MLCLPRSDRLSTTSKVYLSPPGGLEKILFKHAKLLTKTVGNIIQIRCQIFQYIDDISFEYILGISECLLSITLNTLTEPSKSNNSILI